MDRVDQGGASSDEDKENKEDLANELVNIDLQVSFHKFRVAFDLQSFLFFPLNS